MVRVLVIELFTGLSGSCCIWSNGAPWAATAMMARSRNFIVVSGNNYIQKERTDRRWLKQHYKDCKDLKCKIANTVTLAANLEIYKYVDQHFLSIHSLFWLKYLRNLLHQTGMIFGVQNPGVYILFRACYTKSIDEF